jgi:DNA mismatch repair protein MutS
VAWLNLASGELKLTEVALNVLPSLLDRLRPAELLVADSALAPEGSWAVTAAQRLAVRRRPKRRACCANTSAAAIWQLSMWPRMPIALAACGALFSYAQATQQRALAHVATLAVEHDSAWLRMDAATRRNLELTETLRGEASPTLLSLLDTCATSMGSRWLRRCLHHPLRERALAEARHQAVDALRADATADSLHDALRGLADIERIGARIALRTARPRDLSSLRDSLARLGDIAAAVPPDGRPARSRAQHAGAAARHKRPARPRHHGRTGIDAARRPCHAHRFRCRARRTARAAGQLQRIPAGPRRHANAAGPASRISRSNTTACMASI